MIIKIRNAVVCFIGAVVLLWGMAPLLLGRIITGMFISIFFSVVLFGAVYMSAYKKNHAKKWTKWMSGILWVCACTGMIITAIFSAIMVFGPAYYEEGPEGAEERPIVVVLGCQIIGDRPSQMLRQRLDIALEIMEANPAVNCVVTGGQGADERHTEASVMKKYLLEKGIAEERIIEEDQSVNTKQNLSNAKELIEEAGWEERIVVVSSEYHLYRAEYYAKSLGFEIVSSAGASTRWELFLASWIREIPAIMQAYVLG